MSRYDWKRAALPVLIFCSVLFPAPAQDFSGVPGKVLAYDELSYFFGQIRSFIADPEIYVLTNGHYIASRTVSGWDTDCETSGETWFYYSSDKGTNWSSLGSKQDGILRGSFFEYGGAIYLIGQHHEGGELVVLSSTNLGTNWTNSGELGLAGPATPNNAVIYNDRVWLAAHKDSLSAPLSSNFMVSASWRNEDGFPDSTLHPEWRSQGEFMGEGQILGAPGYGLTILPKTRDLPLTGLGLVDTNSGEVSFSPSNDFVSLAGGEKKFGAAYDSVSNKFYICSNPVLPCHDGSSIDPNMMRNTLAVLSSDDMRNWKVVKLLLYSNDERREGFGYPQLDFDGDHMLVMTRTSMKIPGETWPEDGRGGHDSNILNFHKWENFRTAQPDHYLVISNNSVLRFEDTQHQDAPLEEFTLGSTFAGSALNSPENLGQDTNGCVYIEESGGRILCFDASGNFLHTNASAPISLQSSPLDIDQPADGSATWILSGSGDWFGTVNWYYWNRPDIDADVAVFGSALTGNRTISVNEPYELAGFRFLTSWDCTFSGGGKFTLNSATGIAVFAALECSPDVLVGTYLGDSAVFTIGAGENLDMAGLNLGGQALLLDGTGTIKIADSAFTMGGGTVVVDRTELTITNSNVLLDGVVEFRAPAGFDPGPGESFKILDGDFQGSMFQSVILPELDAGLAWDISRLYSSGTITVAASIPGVSIADAGIYEGDSGKTGMDFTVTLSEVSWTNVQCCFVASNGTATVEDNDFDATNGVLTIPSGLLSGTITVMLNGDGGDTETEYFTLTITNIVGGTNIDVVATGTIWNDDSAPASTVPFAETFEDEPSYMANDTGSSWGGQHDWVATVPENAIVQESVVFLGSRAGSLSGSRVYHDFATASATNVWVDFYLRGSGRLSVSDPVSQAGPVCEFYINVNSNIAGSSGDGWVTNHSYVVPSMRWTRFAVNIDYPSEGWSLYAADDEFNQCSSNIFADLPFRSSETAGTYLTRFSIASTDETSTVYFDNFSIGHYASEGAPLHIDSDNDGISDLWEEAYLGGLTMDGTADTDRDGRTDLEEYIAGTDPDNDESYMRILDADLSSPASANVTVTWEGGGHSVTSAYAGDMVGRVYRLMASDNAYGVPTSLVASVDEGSMTDNTFEDVGAADRYNSRFYSIILADYAGFSVTNTEDWAMFRQERAVSGKYLVCVPVNYSGTNANLNSKLGAHLARGMYAHDTASNADKIRLQDEAAGIWYEYYLSSTGWRTNDAGQGLADLTLSPGRPMWIIRGPNTAPDRTNAVFIGTPWRETTITNYTVRAKAGAASGWTMIGWPIRESKVISRSNTGANQMGFWDAGAVGGATGDWGDPALMGDQIYIWRNGGWRQIWLVDVGTHGTVDHPGYDGRWWDEMANDYFDWTFQPGDAFYYYHTTNYGGTSFVWNPAP